MANHDKAFYTLLISSSISSIGDGIRTLIVPLIILYLTNSSFLFGLVLSFEFLVWIIFTGFSGYVVDKTNRVHNLVYSNLILAILMSVVSLSYFIAYSYLMYFLIITVIGVSIGETFFNPSIFSLLPDIIHKNLEKRNALLSASVNASLLGGYIIAGFGYSFIPWGYLLGADALSFLVSSMIIYAGLKSYSRNEKVEKINFLQDTKETYHFIKTNRVIIYTIFFGIIFNFLTSGIIVIIPTIAIKSTTTGSFSLSLFYIAELLGMVAGGSIIAMRKKEGKLLNYLLIGSVGEGVVMVVIAFSLFFSDLIMVLIITLILLAKGLFSETINIPYLVWYQKLVPKKIRAKLNNVKDLILTLPMLLSFPLVGYLLDKFPNWLIIFILGFFTIIGSLIEYSVLCEIFKKDALTSTI